MIDIYQMDVFLHFSLKGFCFWIMYSSHASLHNRNVSQGIVSRECAHRKVPLHVASAAHQLFLSGLVPHIFSIII